MFSVIESTWIALAGMTTVIILAAIFAVIQIMKRADHAEFTFSLTPKKIEATVTAKEIEQ